ncbi:MAG TPA: ATP-binding protein [Anaerolineae bacterium]|nr:ATP-binding protein [Anaerolineae bacterium]HQI83037.1 ATP-binding protein [Anaerolineae bacterium]
MKPIDEIVKQIRDATSKANTRTSSSTEPTAVKPVPVAENEPAIEDTAASVSPGRTMLGRPDCPLCQGMGYVRLDVPVDHPSFGKLFPCTCRTREIQSQRTESLRLTSNLATLERFTFKTFRPEGHGLSPERQENLRRAYDTALAYAQHPDGWLLLLGGYGCGKTHLAAAIANVALDKGLPAIFVTVPDLLDYLRAAYAPTSPTSYDRRFEEVRTAPLLILDDLGTEHATQWALEKLFQLLNYRYMAHLPTVITTNRDLEDMEPRLRSRLGDPELVQIATILAPDFRQAGVDHTESNLNTLVLYADMTLDSFDLRRDELEAAEADNLERALEQARAFAANPIGWLTFTGTYGCGKTHLAAGIANARAHAGYPALFVVVPDLLDHLRAAFNPQSPVTYDKRFEEVRRAPFLVLDDLGTESATQWAQEKLFQLLNHRYVAKLPTVLTTARRIEDLDPKLHTRLLDVSRCTVFSILAPAYRGSGGAPRPAKPARSRQKPK